MLFLYYTFKSKMRKKPNQNCGAHEFAPHLPEPPEMTPDTPGTPDSKAFKMTVPT